MNGRDDESNRIHWVSRRQQAGMWILKRTHACNATREINKFRCVKFDMHITYILHWNISQRTDSLKTEIEIILRIPRPKASDTLVHKTFKTHSRKSIKMSNTQSHHNELSIQWPSPFVQETIFSTFPSMAWNRYFSWLIWLADLVLLICD